jgi:hypothetical protein
MKTNFKYFGIFLLLFVVMNFFAFSDMVLGQEDRSAQITEALFQNTKIVRSNKLQILTIWNSGKTWRNQ